MQDCEFYEIPNSTVEYIEHFYKDKFKSGSYGNRKLYDEDISKEDREFIQSIILETGSCLSEKHWGEDLRTGTIPDLIWLSNIIPVGSSFIDELIDKYDWKEYGECGTINEIIVEGKKEEIGDKTIISEIRQILDDDIPDMVKIGRLTNKLYELLK